MKKKLYNNITKKTVTYSNKQYCNVFNALLTINIIIIYFTRNRKSVVPQAKSYVKNNAPTL